MRSFPSSEFGMRSAEFDELKVELVSFISIHAMSKNGAPALHINKYSGCERADYSTRFELWPG